MKNNFMARILRIIVRTLIVIVIVQLTTFGWRPSREFSSALSGSDQQRSERLKITVNTIAGKLGPRNYVHHRNLDRTKIYITKWFKHFGYAVHAEKYQIEGQEFENIIAEMPQTHELEDVIIIGAHYDTCFNPGADDNASG